MRGRKSKRKGRQRFQKKKKAPFVLPEVQWPGKIWDGLSYPFVCPVGVSRTPASRFFFFFLYLSIRLIPQKLLKGQPKNIGLVRIGHGYTVCVLKGATYAPFIVVRPCSYVIATRGRVRRRRQMQSAHLFWHFYFSRTFRSDRSHNFYWLRWQMAVKQVERIFFFFYYVRATM